MSCSISECHKVLTCSRAVIALIVVATALQGAFLVQDLGRHWFNDVRFWTVVALIASEIVILAVQHLEHDRARNPNGIVLFYWVFFIISYAVKLRSLVSRDAYKTRLPFFVVAATTLGLSIVEFILEYLLGLA